MSVATLKDLWAAISAPWSQVRDPRRCAGRSFIAATNPSRTASAPWSAVRCTSITYRVVRSTKVAIADWFSVPVIRSPSLRCCCG